MMRRRREEGVLLVQARAVQLGQIFDLTQSRARRMSQGKQDWCFWQMQNLHAELHTPFHVQAYRPERE